VSVSDLGRSALTDEDAAQVGEGLEMGGFAVVAADQRRLFIVRPSARRDLSFHRLNSVTEAMHRTLGTRRAQVQAARGSQMRGYASVHPLAVPQQYGSGPPIGPPPHPTLLGGVWLCPTEVTATTGRPPTGPNARSRTRTKRASAYQRGWFLL
jgi:hypothetical protein